MVMCKNVINGKPCRCMVPIGEKCPRCGRYAW